MKTIRSNRHYQTGAVSLFVVIFATLLITVVTVGFLRLMINDQRLASDSDLSQSAYDSAQAGVEDAKRSLIRYRTICDTNGDQACRDLAGQLNDVACNQALRVGGVILDQTDPVEVQQSSDGSDSLNQAYTCVKIFLRTDDYLGSVSANESKLIPLIGRDKVDGSTQFNTVTIEWFSADDLSTGSGGKTVSILPQQIQNSLLAQSGTNSWPANRPPVMRAQLMQFGKTFTLSDFDTANGAISDANTIFLYPTSTGAAGSNLLTDNDIRATVAGEPPADTKGDTPFPTKCVEAVDSGLYSCTQTLTLPDPVGGGDRTAYLKLTPFYNAAHFRVTLSNVTSTEKRPIQFNGVQPAIDSTGRANDLYRRVETRVDLIDTSFPYPESAVDTSGNLCKDFIVTDRSEDYKNNCTP